MKFLEVNIILYVKRFLNNILLSEDLKGDRYFEAFLSIPDEKEYKAT